MKRANHLFLIETFEPARRFWSNFPMTLSPSFKPCLISTKVPVRCPNFTGVSTAQFILGLKYDWPAASPRLGGASDHSRCAQHLTITFQHAKADSATSVVSIGSSLDEK